MIIGTKRKSALNEIESTVDFVLKELATEREYEQKQARLDLFAMLDKYIEEKAAFVSKNQVKDYKSLRKHLNEMPKGTIPTINLHTCRRSFCTNMYLSGFLAEELI